MEIKRITGELIFRDNSQLIKEAVINAILKGANLSWADLSEANLRWANLSWADLSEANLSWANLSDANLRGANLRGANLRDANLSEANLRGANLRDANLSGANLSGANLSDANLSEANLSGANLSDANLSEAKGIIYAQVSFNWHGERGRQLSAVKIGEEVFLFCGCFKGSEDDLKKYIRDSKEEYIASRTSALNAVMSLIKI